MAHYHKGRGQQSKKWERFKQRYGISPSEWRELKKKDPKSADELRMKAHTRFISGITIVKL